MSSSSARAGSSPLARGTQGAVVLWLALARLIPARAGNTGGGVICWYHSTAHPRSRGEHRLEPLNLILECGSSPLARGTRAGTYSFRPPPRLIPARAGNTSGRGYHPGEEPAHPRSRGEHVRFPTSCLYSSGSSPLARGTRIDELGDKTNSRLIPARAGNTRSTTRSTRRRPAHPRSRGEHTPRAHIDYSAAGSSPLARGTLHIQIIAHRGDRLIPARAGNTLYTSMF